MNKLKISGAAVSLMALAAPAFAGSMSTTIPVTANIVAACSSVSATALSFGNLTGAAIVSSAATGTISIVCQPGTPFTVDLDSGLAYQAGFNVRTMTGPIATTLAYNVYTDAAHTTLWGSGLPGGTAVSSTGTQVLTTYGLTTSPGTFVVLGSYTDTITVLLSF